MPDVAADSDTGVLASWLVEESARFDAAQTIAYVETADELFSVEAGRPGVLLKTLVAPGTQVAPGTPIGLLGEPWEQITDVAAVLAELGVVRRERVSAAPLEASVSGHRAEPDPPQLFDSPQPLSVVATSEGEGRSARHAAVSETVAETLAEPDPEPEAAPDEGLAQQHHYLRARVRVDRLVALSARLERDRPESSVIDLVGRSVIAAHRQVPQLGVARIAHDKGAPVGIPITFPGRFGVEEAAAVVPQGQAAVLAVGAVRDEPVIDAGAVIPGKVMTLTLSVRAGRVDDVQASRWLAVLVALLERPEWLID
jgi:pyruvate dehydrogenase E2 component (dihydrolipoamide acetyltransferase)